MLLLPSESIRSVCRLCEKIILHAQALKSLFLHAHAHMRRRFRETLPKWFLHSKVCAPLKPQLATGFHVTVSVAPRRRRAMDNETLDLINT